MNKENRTNTDFRDELAREQVRLVFQDLSTMQSVSFIVAIVLSFIARNDIPHEDIFAWDLMILTVVASRIVLRHRFLKVREGPFSAGYWKKAYLVLAFISGIVWGLSAFTIFPAGGPWIVAIFLLAIASLSAATTMSHSSIRLGPVAWAGPVLLLYAVRSFAEGGEPGYAIGSLIMLYLFGVIRFSLIHNRAITSAISLKFENLRLFEEVGKTNVLLYQDIIRRRQAEEALDKYRQHLEQLVERRTAELLEVEKRYRLLFENARDAIFIIDAEGRDAGKIAAANETAEKMHGYTIAELLKMTIRDVDSSRDEKLSPERLELILQGERLKAEIKHRRRDGTIFPVEISSGIFDQGGHRYAFAIERDITERKKAEEKIKASLAEKEILLKEIYHRTRNNMQVISGLLNLASMSIGDSGLKQVFKETQDRIMAMALVHEKLYKSKDLSNLDMKEYIEDLSAAVMESYRANAERVSLKIAAERIPLSIDLVVPCGLIINELLSNSLKYAFPGRRQGEIGIAVHKKGEEMELVYADNGVGLPEGFDIKKTRTLGLRLVNNLVSGQLKGQLQVHRKNGTEYRINFNLTEQ